MYRLLAADQRLHRQGKLSALIDDPCLGDALNTRMFDVVYSGSSEEDFFATMGKPSLSCIVVDAQIIAASEKKWRDIIDSLQVGGLLLVVDECLSGVTITKSDRLHLSAEYDLLRTLKGCVGLYHLDLHKQASRQVSYDWRPALSITRSE